MSAAKKGKPGRKLSEEELAKLRAANLGKKHSDEAKAKMRAAKLGKPGPWLGIKRGPVTPEWAAKISAANKGRPAYYPLRRYVYKDTPFRSSWEMFVAKAFDARGILWQWETKQFDLGEQTYRPDFYLPELDCYWEVKGYFGPQAQATIKLFRERFPEINLVVATKEVIKQLDPNFNPRLRIKV